jgi:hypothetical protein
MKADETERVFTVKIINDDEPEGNETFGIALYDELGDHRLTGQGTFTTVTILDNDNPGFIGFASNEIECSYEAKTMTVLVKRYDGACGEASCTLRASTICGPQDASGVS